MRRTILKREADRLFPSQQESSSGSTKGEEKFEVTFTMNAFLVLLYFPSHKKLKCSSEQGLWRKGCLLTEHINLKAVFQFPHI